jgi:integrase
MSHGFKFVRLVKGRYPRFRTRETGDLPLPGPIGSPAFLRDYAALLELRDARRGRVPDAGPDPASWAHLIDTYLASPEFAALADSTQASYLRTCALLRAELGDQPFALTTKAMLKAVRDDHAATTRKAHKIKQMSSRLYTFAAECSLVPDGFNPAAGLKRIQRKGGPVEITAWSDAEIEWILAAAPPHAATPILVALYTGQRRTDVAAMRWDQWQGDVIRVRTSKTGALLDLACHPVLKAHLESLRGSRKVVAMSGEIALSDKGKAFTPDGMSAVVRRVVEKVASESGRIAGSRSMHGLRYASASRMEEGGATHAEIAEVLGHRTFKMALKYAGQRVRARSAVEAMAATNGRRTNRESGN